MKRKLLLIITLVIKYSYGQTECPFDQSKFSGTVTVSGVGASETKASDAANSYRFGERVAIDGNIAAVASRSNGAAAGKVYVFINDGSGNWTQQTILTASDGFAGDNFGSAVALEGNYLVVGARSQLNAGGVDTGAAYLFEYDGSSIWTEVAIFEPSDGATGYRFGESVSIEGDLVLVGARNGCTGGCAYLYENDGTNTFTYTETKLEPQVQSNYDGARFGYDVLVKDGRAYVGGPQDYSSVGNASAGSVQIWDQANDGSWSRTHRLRGTETTEYFGSAISVQGDYLAIGAYNFETSSTPEADQGRVYVYKVDSNGDYLDTNRVMIQNDDKDSYNDQRFGTDVALEDGFLYVGTFGNGAMNTDAVYIFKDDGTNTWTQISKITSGGGWDEFSNRAVAVSFPTLLIGQNEADSPSNSGSTYFIQLNNNVQPVASVTESVGTHPTINDGILKVSFDDEATETEIHFSIDGGNTYPYTFNDNLGNAEITGLGAANYDVWVQFDASCPMSLGSFEISIDYTTIPDTNFEAALEMLGYDDISGDGKVPTRLIEVVTSLDVSNQGIADLTGINDFVALEVLRLQYNNLTSLDVSNLINLRTLWAANGNIFNTIDVSNNTALEDFRLRQYRGTSIDISNNTALTRFACTSCDLLTVDTSANTNLSFLDLWDSDITSLDVSSNVNLGTLDIAYTDISSLDLSSNVNLTSLIANDLNSLVDLNIKNGFNTSVTNFNTANTPISCIIVDDVAYSTTNWTNIDGATSFSSTYCEYTAIPDTNFEAALNALGYDDISNDGQVPTALIEVVTTLDVSNQSIADLTGIENFIALVSLGCEDNSLSSLDVSNNTNLQTLIFDNNNVSTLTLGANTNLNSIEGRYNQLASIDLSQNTNLTFINLRDNLFATIDVSNNPLLETINLRTCTNLTSLDLTNNNSLEQLYLQDCALNNLDISQNTLLEVLALERNNVSAIDVSNNAVLRQLRVSDNNIDVIDVTNNPVLTRLDCSNNNLIDLDVRNGNNTAIVTADFDASGNTSLTCISVDDVAWSTTNWTNIDGSTSFSNTYCRYTAIPDSSFEARLEDLGYDDISGDGQVPTTLIENVTYLYIPYNAANTVADLTGIEDFVSLETLNCSGSDLTVIDLSNNLQLKDVDLSNNDISSITVTGLTNLEELNLRGNSLSSLDVTSSILLLDLDVSGSDINSLDVTNSTLLKDLNIDSNNITTIDLTNNTLLESFSFSSTPLTTLDVSNNTKLTYIEGEYTTQLTVLDLSTLILLEEVYLNDSDVLTYVDIRNGNNNNISDFETTNSPNLSCIPVDDVSFATANWTVDIHTSFTSTAYCRYTSIPDTIFEARLEALGYDDISADGQVPTALIEVVSSLNVNDIGINDLTGIEDFIALISLNCRGNNLTTLDVSQNTLLETLTANNNNLPSIDISNNTVLKSVNLGANNLTTLDVSNNTALELLSLQVNSGLTSIDISNNVLLEQLRTYSTNIASLDLSNHPNLEVLQSYNSALTAIDVSNNPVLEELRVNGTSVTELDLSNNPNIINLRVNDTGIETLDLNNQTALQNLFAHDTSLSYLNVKNGNNTNVGTFRVEDNPNLSCILVDDETYSTTNWTSIDLTTNFSDTYCKYTAIPDTNFEAELEALGYDDISNDGQVPTVLIEGITTLNVNNKAITDVTGIEDFIALTSLTVSDNNLGTIDVSNNINLVTLDCQFAGLSTLNVSSNTLLKNLYANGNSISSIDVSNNTELVQLGMYDNDLGAIDLSNNTKLTTIDFFGNQLTNIDVSNNTLLEDILLEGNNLTSLDVSANTVLKNLTCNNNDLETLNIQSGANTNINTFNATNNSSLYCILVDDQAYSTSNWTNVDGTVSFNEISCNQAVIAPKVFLQGAMLNPITGEENWMRDDLRADSGAYGSTSPYGDGAMISESVRTDDVGANSMVDWIWVELRDANDLTIIVAGKSAVLQRDGDIVDVADDRITPLTFEVPTKKYYVVINHRNHLAIRSANTISLSNTTTSVNLSNDNTSVLGGANAVVDLGNGIFAMIGGDYDGNGQVQNSDVNEVIQKLGSSGYNNADLDMNGQIQNTDINNIMNPNLGKGQQF
ncbi:hypothetical protein [Aquimarina sp. 2201CG5-10]|uniref:hypothetical protein n=1 Tax=Aquimarina callyspongiae TaxID=3098150 RepID=UPI002AB41845|nr:hypothetical protein [Aquimarina sp. 2201CG5-10]MDY8138030.1 hypothetical protein [Aquimarina sp. 2201CG5-10]